MRSRVLRRKAMMLVSRLPSVYLFFSVGILLCHVFFFFMNDSL